MHRRLAQSEIQTCKMEWGFQRLSKFVLKISLEVIVQKLKDFLQIHHVCYTSRRTKVRSTKAIVRVKNYNEVLPRILFSVT